MLPGPLFHARSGDAVTVPFTNMLTEPTTVHWHGLVVPTAVDGQPHDPVAPGASFTYAFTLEQRAALYWYHPHPHMLTSEQVAYGLAGGFVVRDAEEDALSLPSGPFEVPLVIRDANIDSSGALSYNGKASGFTGSVLLVNGTKDPYLATSPAIHRLRLLGGTNSRVFRLTLSNGAPFTLVGNDGGLLPTASTVNEIELSPGERVDALVDLRTAGGTTVSIMDAKSGWTILEFRVSNTTPVAGTIPSGTLSSIAPLSPPLRTRNFSFDGMTRINGKLYDLNRIDFTVPAGQVEDWVFTTNGNAPHPVHIHGASFQVVSRSGGRARLFPWEAGWKDTVLLNDGETVRVRIRFDLRGRYLIHCHKLEHEDAGMMANFVVQ
jgi:FtsP/CotA-like multicopper oxidase with cupredoxin domain